MERTLTVYTLFKEAYVPRYSFLHMRPQGVRFSVRMFVIHLQELNESHHDRINPRLLHAREIIHSLTQSIRQLLLDQQKEAQQLDKIKCDTFLEKHRFNLVINLNIFELLKIAIQALLDFTPLYAFCAVGGSGLETERERKKRQSNRTHKPVPK